MAKSNALWKFLTKDVKMSSGEASQYMSGLSKTVSKNDEKAFVDHLRQKLSQGKVQGEHLDDTLSDSLKEALSVQNSLGVGLGDRIYNSTKYNQKYSSTEGLKQRLESLRDSDTKLRDLARDTTKAWSSERTPAVRSETPKVNRPVPTSSQYLRQMEQGLNAPDIKYMSDIVDSASKPSFSTRYKQLKDQEDFARNQFASTSMLSTVADEYGIKKNAKGLEEVRKIIEDRKQGVLGVGSKQSLQEGTLTYKPQALSDMKPEEWSEMERKTGISDLGFSSKSVSSDNGMPIATTTRELSIDEAILKGHIKQNDMPGTKAANDMLYGKVKKGLESQHASIMKSDLSQEEKNAKWKTAREEAIERLRNGATFQDYFFGNRVHHGLAGMAAITGTLGVAFGGHKSNAELYSSPF